MKAKISKDVLERLYIKQGMGLETIAAYLGWNRGTIRTRMIRFGIPRRSPGGHGNRPRIPLKICEICGRHYKSHTFDRAKNSHVCSKKCFGIRRQTDPALIEKAIANLPHDMVGDKNGNWRGGTSNMPYAFAFDETLKLQIRNRDNHTCQLCETTQDEQEHTLNIHHINYRKDDSRLENLITLCRSCNSKTNGNRSHWQSFFQAKIKRIYEKGGEQLWASAKHCL